MFAVRSAVEDLLARDADITGCDAFGNTALRWALFAGSPEIEKRLLSSEACEDARNIFLGTPRNYADALVDEGLPERSFAIEAGSSRWASSEEFVRLTTTVYRLQCTIDSRGVAHPTRWSNSSVDEASANLQGESGWRDGLSVIDLVVRRPIPPGMQLFGNHADRCGNVVQTKPQDWRD